MWGARGSSSVPLNYAALNSALKERAANNRVRNKEDLPLYSRNVHAYRKGADIALRLHNTEIVHFHPDGTQSLFMGGWNTVLTWHWLGEAHCPIYHSKRDRWNDSVSMIFGAKFYDGIHVDARNGVVLSERFPIPWKVPSVEAKALRRRLTKLAQVYREFAMLHAGNQGKNFECTYRRSDQDILAIDPATHEFDLNLYSQLTAPMYSYGYRFHRVVDPYAVLQRYLASVYESTVRKQELFDVTAVQPKEI